MSDPKFIERRKQYRLPYHEKVVYTDGQRSGTAYGLNISRGGIFIRTLEPYPINTVISVLFMLPNQPQAMCIQSRVPHIVYDRQRCEIDNGMGIQFLELTEQQKSMINLHIMNEKMGYLELKKILSPERPNRDEIERYLHRLPALRGLDLLGLRYQVNRICTLFETPEEPSFAEALPKSA